jgi:hypothetical protein
MRRTELKRAAISLATLLALDLIYSALVVPFIEPPAPRRMRSAGHVGTAVPAATDRYQSELAGLFAADAWENESPKILRIRNILVLFQDYQPQDDGTLRVFPCTAVVLGDRSSEEDRRASSLILQAPDGAILQLDRPAAAHGTQLGQPLGGFLLGKIRIHSHGQPDGTGRLNILTSDVQISHEMILTPHEVDLQYEQSRALGRDLMIKLLPLKNNRSIDRSQGWAGIRSIELVHLEHLHLEIEDEAASDTKAPAVTTPVDIVCRGPLRVDFIENLVTLEEDVELRRQTAGGVIDTLQCQKLSLHLLQAPLTPSGPTAQPSATPPASAGATSPRRSARDPNRLSSLPQLEVGKVVAEGNPVVLDAPSRGAHVRSRRLVYDLQLGRFQLWAAPDLLSDHVLLRYGRQELMARELDCWLDSPQGIKHLRATGPGRFVGEMDGSDPQPVQADWLTELVFLRENELHRLTLDGGARARVGNHDGIEADVIHLWLEPAPQPLASGETGAGQQELSRLAMRPKRVLAVGPPGRSEGPMVTLWSNGIVATTAELDAQFQHSLTVPAADSAPPATTDPPIGRPGDADATIRPASLVSQADAAAARPSPTRETRIAGRTLSATLRVRGRDVTIDNLLLQDNVHVQQFALEKPDKPLFDLRADAVRIVDPTQRQMHRITAVGQPVSIQAEQLRMRTSQLYLDQAHNVVWSDRQGSMIVMVDRDANGRQLAMPQEMSIDWLGNMAFNGVQAHFEGGVDVRSAEQRMHGETLDVQLAHPLSFSNSSSNQRTEIRQVDVKGNVLIELAQYEQQQLVSVTRLQVPYARIDRQSGDMHASGPGRLTTVRAGFRGDWNPAAGSQPRVFEPSASDTKTFLQVDYQREITGNLYRNIVEFWDRVQVIYGPVLSWNETITAQGSLRSNDVLLSCDRLTVSQASIGPPSAPSDRRLLDLLAQGNTYVEGQTFTARGDRVSYTQAKELLVLEGTGRTDAVLSHQTRVGAPRSETAARRILYWVRTGRAEIADGRMLDLSNLGQ